MTAAIPVITAIGSIIGPLASAFMGGGAPSAPDPAPAPPPPAAPEPEPFVDPEGVQDEAATRARALRRRKESANQGGLLNLSGEDSKSGFLNPKTLGGQ